MSATNRQSRLDTLKIREAEGILTEKERTELNAIFAELDAEEAVALKPAKEKHQAFIDSLLEEERELETTIAQLQVIVTAQTQLVEDARAYLMQLRAKHAILRC
jgi:phage shock protein A